MTRPAGVGGGTSRGAKRLRQSYLLDTTSISRHLGATFGTWNLARAQAFTSSCSLTESTRR